MNKYCAVVCDDAVADDYCKSQSLLRTDGNIKISYCIVKTGPLSATCLFTSIWVSSERFFFFFTNDVFFCGKDESCKVFLGPHISPRSPAHKSQN